MIKVRKQKNKEDVDVIYSFLDSTKAYLEGKDIKEYLIEEIKPIAKKRKWNWFFKKIKEQGYK